MTRFLDGPAKGQHLMLRRTPIFLRVTEENGKFDALNEPGDTPRKAETITAYILTERPGMCCIRASGGRGGIFYSGNYRLCDPQPDDQTMRNQIKWERWLDANRAMVPAELLPK